MHQSKALVEFSRKMLFPNFFRLKSGHKNPKKSVKIRLFKGRFKKSCDMKFIFHQSAEFNSLFYLLIVKFNKQSYYLIFKNLLFQWKNLIFNDFFCYSWHKIFLCHGI
jgi:hypothetical protein